MSGGAFGTIQIGLVDFFSAQARVDTAAGDLLLSTDLNPELSTTTTVMDEYRTILQRASGYLASFQAMLKADSHALGQAGDALQQTDQDIGRNLLA